MLSICLRASHLQVPALLLNPKCFLTKLFRFCSTIIDLVEELAVAPLCSESHIHPKQLIAFFKHPISDFQNVRGDIRAGSALRTIELVNQPLDLVFIALKAAKHLVNIALVARFKAFLASDIGVRGAPHILESSLGAKVARRDGNRCADADYQPA